jgi:hypothetical protein
MAGIVAPVYIFLRGIAAGLIGPSPVSPSLLMSFPRLWLVSGFFADEISAATNSGKNDPPAS